MQNGPQQIGKYDKGVGSDPRQPGESIIGYWNKHARELCFGEGVAQNLLELYTYLIEHYKPGDRLFLFGFSRGAFTVRALAGLIHVCGVLPSHKASQTPNAVRLNEGSEERIVQERRRRGLPPKFSWNETDHGSLDPVARDFKASNGHACVVEVLGVWDTVKAYRCVPRASLLFATILACAWCVTPLHLTNAARSLRSLVGATRHSEVKEVWFAGDHSDLGYQIEPPFLERDQAPVQ